MQKPLSTLLALLALLPLRAAIVDRLRGEPFSVPLLRQWKSVTFTIPLHYNNAGFIGRIPSPQVGTGEVCAHLRLAQESLACDYNPEVQARQQSAIPSPRFTPAPAPAASTPSSAPSRKPPA